VNADDAIDMALRVLFETFGHSPTPAQVEGYRLGLEGLSPDAIGSAVRLALRESERLPTPAKIRDLTRRQAVKPLGPALPAIRRERARVMESWKGGPPVPTLDEMVSSCYANACLAEKQAEAVKAAIDRRMPGDPDLKQLNADLERHMSDYRHWSDYVGHYRGRVAKEGGATVPLVTLPGRAA
jgi:hypothetical protein